MTSQSTSQSPSFGGKKNGSLRSKSVSNTTPIAKRFGNKETNSQLKSINDAMAENNSENLTQSKSIVLDLKSQNNVVKQSLRKELGSKSNESRNDLTNEPSGNHTTQ